MTADALHVEFEEFTYHAEGGEVRTTFSDGSVLVGVASCGDEDEERARQLGYEGDREAVCWQMHRDHDLCHHVAMRALGWPYSPMLHMAARGFEKFPAGLYAQEERLAFLVQRAVNVGRAVLRPRDDPSATRKEG